VDNGDGLTVTDHATGIMWQRGGCDLTTIRNVQQYVAQLNRQRFAGFAEVTVTAEASGRVVRIFHDVGDIVRPGDVLVRNDTRVIPARRFMSV